MPYPARRCFKVFPTVSKNLAPRVLCSAGGRVATCRRRCRPLRFTRRKFHRPRPSLSPPPLVRSGRRARLAVRGVCVGTDSRARQPKHNLYIRVPPPLLPRLGLGSSPLFPGLLKSHHRLVRPQVPCVTRCARRPPSPRRLSRVLPTATCSQVISDRRRRHSAPWSVRDRIPADTINVIAPSPRGSSLRGRRRSVCFYPVCLGNILYLSRAVGVHLCD